MTSSAVSFRSGVLLTVVASCAFAAAEELKYNIQPEQVVPYRVKITIKTPTSEETMSGLIAFTGKSTGDERFTVEYTGSLSRSTKTRGGRGEDADDSASLPCLLCPGVSAESALVVCSAEPILLSSGRQETFTA